MMILGRRIFTDEGRFFEYRYNILGENGSVMPKCFKFVTENESEESQHLWKIHYDMNICDSYLLQNIPLQNTCYKITRIKISSQNNLMKDYFAEVNIFSNDIVYHRTYFNSLMPAEEEIYVEVRKDHNPYFLISIKCQHSFGVDVNRLIEDYAEFLENETLSDVTFVIQDEEITAHKQILSARNCVLKTMFESDMLEKSNGRVEIKDVEPKIFKLLLGYMYTGRVDSSNFDDWLKLMIAADRYSDKNLMKNCENNIINNLTIENVIHAFDTAYLVTVESLKERTVKFILKNKDQVIKTEAYKNFLNSPSASGFEMLRYLFEQVIEI